MANRGASSVNSILFLALDENNQATRVPALELLSDIERRRFQQADIRRAARLKTVEDLKQI